MGDRRATAAAALLFSGTRGCRRARRLLRLRLHGVDDDDDDDDKRLELMADARIENSRHELHARVAMNFLAS